VSAAQLAAFLGVSAFVIVTPGQDTALTIRNTLLGGRSGGIATAAGVVSGQLVWALAASAGLSAVLLASAPLFMAIRIAGAAYLVLLGVQALVAAIRGVHRVDADAAPRRRRAPYRQGVLSNLGNPKMAVFFTSLLPQFGAAPAELAVHALAFSALTLGWLCLVARAGAASRVPAVRRLIDAVTGVVLVAFGLRLAAGRR
jgi:threonine/homoserine/homoserine lactone efflux protein